MKLETQGNEKKARSARLARSLAFWSRSLLLVLLFALGEPASAHAPPGAAPKTPEADKNVYAEDIKFALEQLEKQCGHFFKLKGIEWSKVEKEFTKAVKKVETDAQHHALLWQLLARLRDGHASVRALEKGQGVGVEGYDPNQEMVVPGFSLCKVGKKFYVKGSTSAREVGLLPGMEVIKIDGEKAEKWIAAKQAEICDKQSFSTDHHAFFYTCHWGLKAEPNTRVKLEVKDGKKKKKKTITYDNDRPYFDGPPFRPIGGKSTKDLNFAITERGFGYIHVRRCKGNLPTQMDEALAYIGNVPGLILDFRFNSGGGFDHDDLFGRFVPKGETMNFGKRIASTGDKPYGGPIVVIVDGTCVSAGETGSGMFKEDGRAYMIGESPTAGMSASKTTIELPSRMFSLYVSIASNKSRFQGGRGIEGIGIEPHEIVEMDPEDLTEGINTQIRHAEDLLEDFPQGKVPYKPKNFGWEAPK